MWSPFGPNLEDYNEILKGFSEMCKVSVKTSIS